MEWRSVCLLALAGFSMIACGGNNAEEESLTDALEKLNEKLDEASGPETEWQTIADDPAFTIDLPSRMKFEPSLNPDANLQYAFAEETDLGTKEHYVIVLVQYKDSIPDYDDESSEFSIEEFGNRASSDLGNSLDEYEIFTAEPEVEEVNGLSCIRYEMSGGMGDVKIYYQIAVYKGDKAFYQLVTWTLENQKEEFKGDMDRMISSFKEK
ncbi:MAG: hypothetical protein IPM77_06460 [Crocinitomicaceae bacterium]|nr:hypothetical protein [Crocinitomicaceae bacterium]